jgi:hypothetical protein
VIFISLCLVQLAKAEPKYVPKIVPECKVLEVSPGKKRCTYTLEEVKDLYRIDAELLRLRDISLLQNRKIALQNSIIVWQQSQLRLSVENTNLFRERINSLTGLYKKTDKKLQAELARPRWGHYVAWGLVATVTTLFTGYVVADQIAK